MTDKTVRLGCVVSYGMWGLAAVLVAVAAIVDSRGVGLVGLMLTAAAVTATIRGYFVNQNRMMQAAFALGRESVAVPAPLQSVN